MSTSLFAFVYQKTVMYLEDFDVRARTMFVQYDSCKYDTALTMYFRVQLTTDEEAQVLLFVTNYSDPASVSTMVENYSLAVNTGPLNVTTASDLITVQQLIYSYRLSRLRTIKLLFTITGTWAVGNGIVIRIWDRVQGRAIVNNTTYLTTDKTSGFSPVLTLTPSNVPAYDSVWQIQIRNSVSTMLVNLQSIQLIYYNN